MLQSTIHYAACYVFGNFGCAHTAVNYIQVLAYYIYEAFLLKCKYK